jgi:hypothetical protein
MEETSNTRDAFFYRCVAMPQKIVRIIIIIIMLSLHTNTSSYSKNGGGGGGGGDSNGSIRGSSRSIKGLLMAMTTFAALVVSCLSIWSSFGLGLGMFDEDAYHFIDQPSYYYQTNQKYQKQIPAVVPKKYHEIPVQEFETAPIVTLSAYSATAEIRRSKWFKPTKSCKDTCCVETVALSLDQDDERIINTLDGMDLADVLIRQYPSAPHLEFFAPSLHLDMLPCLQPGTIIHIDNHRQLVSYFFETVRPHITIPYLLMTTESDDFTPAEHANRLQTDELLLKWYGSNMDWENLPASMRKNATVMAKLNAVPLGLSKHHVHQSYYLTRLLQINNYTNPFSFANKQRWIKWAENNNATASGVNIVASADAKADADADEFLIFVKFGIPHASHRRAVFETLCGPSSSSAANKNDNNIKFSKYNKDAVSCNESTAGNNDTYISASRYLFGMSPPGAGWDCYRTYELLLLGVIPIVEAKQNEGDDAGVFHGLPVVQVHDLLQAKRNLTRDDYVILLRDYILSPAFQNTSFDAGWERLFLRYWRRRVLKDTGRQKDILQDEQGREYYQAFQYYTTSQQHQQEPKYVYCSQGDSCQTKEG